MTYRTNLYGGWWVYGGLAGLGLALLLLSRGRAGLWPGLILLVALALAALLAFVAGYGPHRRLQTVLSERGITLNKPARAGEPTERFIPWSQILAVRITPQPGYWKTWIQAHPQPDTWLPVGHGLDLAETIAEIAALSYDEGRTQHTNMGREHYWARP